MRRQNCTISWSHNIVNSFNIFVCSQTKQKQNSTLKIENCPIVLFCNEAEASTLFLVIKREAMSNTVHWNFLILEIRASEF